MKPAASKAEALTNNRDHGRIVTLSTKLLKSLVIAPTLIIIPKKQTLATGHGARQTIS